MNYLVRLGWSSGDQEIFSRQEMIELFDLKAVNKAAAAFNPEKLAWLNQHYMKQKTPQVMTALEQQFEQQGIDISTGPSLDDIVALQAERCKTLTEMAEKSHYFYQDVTEYDQEAMDKHINAEIIPLLKQFNDDLAQLDEWTSESSKPLIKSTCKAANIKFSRVAQPLRIAMTGNILSPSIDAVLQLIGKQRVLDRLQRFIIRVEV